MEVTRGHGRISLALIASFFIGCGTRSDVAALPTTRETLQAIGRRLSRSYSEHDLSIITSREESIVARLDRRERAALAHGYLRFHVDSSVTVDVAVPVKSIPFWIADQGFQATTLSLENCDSSWAVYRKYFEPGWIGLGVNGLDRTPVAHYVVFVGSRRTRSAFTAWTSTPRPRCWSRRALPRRSQRQCWPCSSRATR